MVCTLEGGLSAMVEQLHDDRFQLNTEAVDSFIALKKEDSDSEFASSDEDSIFESNQPKGVMKYSLTDKVKGREVTEGSKVKVQITKVIVTDESIISSVKLL